MTAALINTALDAPVKRAPSRVVASLPPGHFLENITADSDGALIIGDYYGEAFYRFTPENGFRLYAKVHFSPLDLAFDVDGVAVVTAHNVNAKASPRFTETNAFYLLNPDGSSQRLLAAPEARFLNGIIRLEPGVFLAADSYTGKIWRIDRSAAKMSVWREDSLFLPGEAAGFDPGLNGLKLYHNHLYASNTNRGLIVRMPLINGSAGAVEVVAEHLRCDDFIFGSSGAMYCAGQGRTVTRIAPDGARTVIATSEDAVLGATAVTFGATPLDRNALYVTATGGLAMGFSEPATFVALQVDDEAEKERQK